MPLKEDGTYYTVFDLLFSATFIRSSFILGLITLLVPSVVKLYYARLFIARLKKRGLPVAPSWNWALGNLMLVVQLAKEMPPKGHKTLIFGEVLRRWFPKQGACYFDLWPVGWAFLIVMSPDIATQATQTVYQVANERPPELDDFFKPIAGGPNLFDMPEKKWKPWRAVFNKGFNSDTIVSLVPGMVEATLLYREVLGDLAAEKKLFQLDLITLRFTLDFIGRTVLNATLGQDGQNTLANSMLSQISWLAPNKEINPFEMINLPRFLVLWWNGRKMDAYIGRELDKRYQEYRRNETSPRGSVMDLVLRAYMGERRSSVIQMGEKDQVPEKIDPQFRAFAVTQIRSFLFLGHDSMSSTICYMFYLLSSNPSTLAKLRAEHNAILGSNEQAASSLLIEKPHVLEGLHYTTAIIKETLRLFPPGSGIRQGAPNAELIGEDGTRYPTQGTMVWVLHTAMQNSEQYWPDAELFIPERWLVEPGHKLYPRKGAWRAFEWGPRACIGQNLAMTQLRTTLALLARKFDIQPAYDEWDSMHPAKGPRTYRGERAYQVEIGASHPADLSPCRVALADSGSG